MNLKEYYGKFTIEIQFQSETRVHFVIKNERGQILHENPNFNKSELIELITEHNYDYQDEEVNE